MYEKKLQKFDSIDSYITINVWFEIILVLLKLRSH